MDWFSIEMAAALLSIVMIDLMLAGDNAILIGMAARNLNKSEQTRAVFFGTLGAVLIRAAATLLVVYLLEIPGLLLGGGMMLVWIAYKLLTENKNQDVQAAYGIWAAIRTIVVADAVMGLDNVIAVAGAAHGHPVLVIVGLLISVPIVVWGSTLFIRWMERFPWILYVGAGVLAWTAAKMMTGEMLFSGFFSANPVVKWMADVLVVAGVLLAGRWKKMSALQVEINDRGHLTLPKALGEQANLEPEESYVVKMDSRGRYILMKADPDRPTEDTMQSAV